MKTFAGLKIAAFPAEQREQMKIVDDMLRTLSAGVSRSISTGQSPTAITVPSHANPTGPSPASGTPSAEEGDLLVGLSNGSWAKLAIGAPGALLKVGVTMPEWLGPNNQLGWTGEWRANGPYLVDTDVDAVLIANTGMTLTDAWISQVTPGSSGNTTLVLKKNGSTIASFSIAFNELNNKKNYPLSNTIVAGDKLTMDITGLQGGTPRDLLLVVKGI
jgi:hypothetical protein